MAHHLATWEAVLWCGVLFTQSLPYAASLFVSVAAAMPGRRPATMPHAIAAWPTAAAGD